MTAQYLTAFVTCSVSRDLLTWWFRSNMYLVSTFIGTIQLLMLCGSNDDNGRLWTSIF